MAYLIKIVNNSPKSTGMKNAPPTGKGRNTQEKVGRLDLLSVLAARFSCPEFGHLGLIGKRRISFLIGEDTDLKRVAINRLKALLKVIRIPHIADAVKNFLHGD